MYFARFQGETNLALKDSVYGNFLGGSEQAIKNPGNILTVSFEGGSVDIYSEFAPKVYKFSLLNMTTPAYFLLFAFSIFFYIALRKTQNTLHKNAVYKDIFDSAYSGLVLINPNSGEISLINTRGELTLGYAVWNKAKKDSFFSHIAEGHREKVIRELNSSDCVRYQHVIINCSDGREIWAVIFIKRLSEQAALVCFSDIDSYARDYLSNQKELGIAYFILNSFPSAFFLTDEKGETIKANISAQIMLGLTSEEILGKTCKELFPSPFGEEMLKNDLEILSGTTKYYAGDSAFSVRGQTEKSYRVNKIPHLGTDGRILGVLSIFDDITESALREPTAKAAADAMYNTLAASGASYSFFLNNSAERKRLERFQTIRLAGLGRIFKYLNDRAETICGGIMAEAGKANIPKENLNAILTAARQIIDISFMERLFRFNEAPKVFSPNMMIKAILARTGINAELAEDDVSKLTMLEAYPAEVEEVFTKLMERLAELYGGFNITLSADSLEYKIIFSFKRKRIPETLDKDIIFLYSWLFIKEILKETWETTESSGSYRITIKFAV
jgi:PAS domain S-box-containing protein